MDNKNVNSFIAGSITGITEVVLGYPLDTIKVNLQNRTFDIYKLKLKYLYSGCTYPLLSNSIIISLEFGVFNYFRNKDYSITTAGMLAGSATSVVMAPIDRFKIKKQILSNNIYKNPYKGFQYVLAREIPATAIYFNSYYYLKESASILLAGGLAGVITWGVTFPLDVIKTRMQSDSYKTLKDALVFKGIYNGIFPCLLRALCINSISFYTYETVIDRLNR
jgi:solute carrier family 25 carnitine/acylcarnitine transporter 20/29